jgi:hypothetical protein
MFTSKDIANLLQYRLFDFAPLPRIIERSKADVRVAREEEL